MPSVTERDGCVVFVVLWDVQRRVVTQTSVRGVVKPVFIHWWFCRKLSRERWRRASKGSCSHLSRSPVSSVLSCPMFALLFCKIDRWEGVDKRGEAAFKEREETAEERQREERWQDIKGGWERKELCRFIFSSPTFYVSHSPERYWRQSVNSRFSFPVYFLATVVMSA